MWPFKFFKRYDSSDVEITAPAPAPAAAAAVAGAGVVAEAPVAAAVDTKDTVNNLFRIEIVLSQDKLRLRIFGKEAPTLAATLAELFKAAPNQVPKEAFSYTTHPGGRSWLVLEEEVRIDFRFCEIGWDKLEPQLAACLSRLVPEGYFKSRSKRGDAVLELEKLEPRTYCKLASFRADRVQALQCCENFVVQTQYVVMGCEWKLDDAVDIVLVSPDDPTPPHVELGMAVLPSIRAKKRDYDALLFPIGSTSEVVGHPKPAVVIAHAGGEKPGFPAVRPLGGWGSA